MSLATKILPTGERSVCLRRLPKEVFLLILPVLSSLSITSAHTYSLMVWQDCLSMYTACVRYVVK